MARSCFVIFLVFLLITLETSLHHPTRETTHTNITMASAKEFKVVLAGQFGTGKTSFATRVRSAKSDKKEIKALKTTQYPVKLQTSAGQVTLNFFDTNLHAKGGLPDDGFFRTADAAVVFFDLTKEESYTAMEDWYDAVIKANGRKGSEPLPIVVVGTKADNIKVGEDGGHLRRRLRSFRRRDADAWKLVGAAATVPTPSANPFCFSVCSVHSLACNRAETSSQKPSSSHARRSFRTARSPPTPSEYCGSHLSIIACQNG